MMMTLEDRYQLVLDTPSDIYQHCPTLRHYANQCKHVTEFGMHYGNSTTSILAAQPDRFVTYDVACYPTYDTLKPLQGKTDFEFKHVSSLAAVIEDTEMLFIDSEHTRVQLSGELTLHADKVSRWIILHDTQIFARYAPSPPFDPETAGLLPALGDFLSIHPEWWVSFHSQENSGLTVLSRCKDDLPRQINLPVAECFQVPVTKYTDEDASAVNFELYCHRLKRCTACDQRAGEACMIYTCPLGERAKWRANQCELGRWRAIA